MADLIDISTGRAAFVSRRLPAWHRLGTVVGNITIDDVFSATGGGLGYTVDMVQAAQHVPMYDADGQPIGFEVRSVPGQFFRRRRDTGITFGPSCTSAYHVQQNRDVMAPIIGALVDSGLAVIETAGALRDGADAWIAVRFRGADFDKAGAADAGDNRTEYYGVIMNNFDGRAKLRVLYTPIRIVCANTQGFALRDRRSAVVGIRHTRSAAEKVQAEAVALWSKAAGHAAEFHAIQETLRRKILTAAQFEAIVQNTVAPLLDETETGITARAKKNRETRNVTIHQQRDTLMRTWFSGTGMSGDPTAWDAYNAVTETLDHNAQFHTQQSNSELLESLLPGGKLETLKNSVLHTLLAL